MRKIIWIVALMWVLNAQAQTNYVLYVEDGEVRKVAATATYSADKDSLQLDDATLGGVDWTRMRFSSFTGPIPEGFTNTAQITGVLTKIHPLTEEELQAAKAPGVKVLENIYVTFLTNEWTGVLRQVGLISSNTVINTTNTDTSANVMYLMQLRSLDAAANKPTYSYYKNEFATFRDNFERMSGTNATQHIRWHPEVAP